MDATPAPIIIMQVQTKEIRIDTFDSKSRRTGYMIIDQRSGRIDQFDTRGNRLGYGTTTTPRPTPDPHQSDRTPTNGTTKGGR